MCVVFINHFVVIYICFRDLEEYQQVNFVHPRSSSTALQQKMFVSSPARPESIDIVRTNVKFSPAHRAPDPI